MNLNNLGSTPIHNITENINENQFYIKRDDLLPVSFGGNKVRKAALFFDNLSKKRADSVVTYGSGSSNHCRIIANIAAAKGIPCHIISPSESNESTINSKMSEMFGALVTQCPVVKVSNTIQKKLDELKEEGYTPYFIQGGGHGNIGTKAYVNAYKEILDYERKIGISFDYIFHASGTGTTQAGLICGKILHADEREIIGISIARRNPYGGQVVFDSVNSYLLSQNKEPIMYEAVSFIDDYILDGYGSYNDKILKTIKDVLISDGIPLDPTYTGKAFWGMKEYVKKHQITNKKILFIHTGGTPLFFDRLEDLNNER